MSAEQTPAIERVLAEHFVMWHDMGGPDEPPGEWRCSCGAKFGWSHDAIAHVAQALAPVLAAAWDEGWRAAGEAYVRGMDAYANGEAMPVSDGPPNPYRADRVAEPQHEAATSGKESEGSDE